MYVRVLHLLGVKRILITNAAGGLEQRSEQKKTILAYSLHFPYALPSVLFQSSRWRRDAHQGPHQPLGVHGSQVDQFF